MRLRKILTGLMLSLGVFTTFSLLNVNAESDGIIDIGAGKECLYGEFDPVSGATSYDAYVKKSTDLDYTKLDSELVRELEKENTLLVRIDAVGLSEGSYNLKFVPKNGDTEITNKIIELSDISVEADDRSGYAHFNYNSGVGAYNDDGTLKDGAEKIYVTEATKNSPVTYNGNTYENFVELLSTVDAIKSKPLVVRFIGTVGAATWNQIEYDPNGTYKANKNLPIENVIGDNNEILINDSFWNDKKQMNEDTIISKGYNTLNTSYYSKLNGLINKINYSSKDNEFDSYYNMLDVDGAENVTVEGIGVDAKIVQWGFTWKRSKSIEVKNLTFENYPEDACGFQGYETTLSNKTTTAYNIDNAPQGNIWVHNNTFKQGRNVWDVCQDQDKHEGDGATDVKFHKDVTYSYNHYYNNHKTGLVGGSESNITANITFHHNWYEGNQSRMPYARQANMHMYNNYYDSSTGTTMQIYAGAYAFIENCYFKNDSKTFELKDKEYTAPAIKSYNNVFNGSKTTTPATIVSSRTESVSNGNIFYKTIEATTHNYSSFDTDSELFYYKNGSTDVKVMNQASELPDLLPTITGAGVFELIDDYKVINNEPTPVENSVVYDNKSYATIFTDDFSDSSRAITKTSSVPTSPGIYYSITGDVDANQYNYLEISNNKLNIYDSSSKTSEEGVDDGLSHSTMGYYIFNSNNQYSSGIIKYNIDLTIPASSKWAILGFVDNTNTVKLSVYSNESKYLGYRYNNNVVNMFSSVYSSGLHKVSLIVDYDNGVTSISIDSVKLTVTDYNPSTIKGLYFMTSEGSKRNYSCSNLSIEKEEKTTKLGYQFGKYTSNQTEYKALRIVGKFEYGGYFDSLDDIDSIIINVDLVNNSSEEPYKKVTQEITDIYKSLSLSNETVIAPEAENTRYYYVVVKGITSSHNGYKINATTTITLKNGVVINCSGFSYTISVQ